MIHIRYAPQICFPGHRIRYEWRGRLLEAILEASGEEIGRETYNLSELGPGDEVISTTPESLPFSPLVEARVDEAGDLHVLLLLWYESGEEITKLEEAIDG